MHVILALKQDIFLEKNSGKKNLVEALDFGYGKLIFALKNKIIAVYVRLISIYL